MTTLVVQHHVRDYDAWKPVFDDHEEGRSRHGATGHTVLRGQEDGNDILVTIDFPDRSSAEAFLADASLREVMARAGVEGQPAISFREEAETIRYGAPVA